MFLKSEKRKIRSLFKNTDCDDLSAGHSSIVTLYYICAPVDKV